MELIIDIVLMRDPYRYTEFRVVTDKKTYLLHKAKLERERKKIVGYFKQFKKEGIIRSIWIPKNKRIQKELDNLVRLKRSIDRSLQKINEFFT